MNRRLICTFCLLALAALTLRAGAASVQHLSIDAGGLPRDYLLATPAAGAPGPRPLVLLLHGHLGTAANALGEGRVPSPLSAWLDIADREQVLVAALQGLKGADNRTGWHDCRIDALENPQADDVGFAERVVQALVKAGRADPQRVYVMGMSNGGMMAYRLALEMKPAPVAIAAVSSSMAAHSSCTVAPQKVSVLLINGTDDPIVPYAGGAVGVFSHKSGSVTGAEATRDFWLRADGLAGVAGTVTPSPHLAATDPTSVLKTTYGPDAGPQVEMITIVKGGHVEPSLRYHYGWAYSRLVGSQNRDFESAEEAWAFFRDKLGK
jgi:polyhydroxybutyrate depolymerase